MNLFLVRDSKGEETWINLDNVVTICLVAKSGPMIRITASTVVDDYGEEYQADNDTIERFRKLVAGAL